MGMSRPTTRIFLLYYLLAHAREPFFRRDWIGSQVHISFNLRDLAARIHTTIGTTAELINRGAQAGVWTPLRREGHEVVIALTAPTPHTPTPAEHLEWRRTHTGGSAQRGPRTRRKVLVPPPKDPA